MKTEISHESKPCRTLANVYHRNSSICSTVQPNCKQENSFELTVFSTGSSWNVKHTTKFTHAISAVFIVEVILDAS